MQRVLDGDPLVDLGVAYVLETGLELTRDHVMAVRSTLEKYVGQMISYRDAAIILGSIIRTAQPLDRIERILQTPLAPLPNLPVLPKVDHRRAKTRPWSQYEDQRLIAGIHRLGTSDWQAISAFVGNNRSKSQCFQRWTRGLDPNINKTKWTPEQDSQLMMLVAVFGAKAWSKISMEFGNRCDVQCRYRYKQLMKESNFDDLQKEAHECAKQFAKTQDVLATLRPKPYIRQVEFPGQVQYRVPGHVHPFPVYHLMPPSQPPGFIVTSYGTYESFQPVQCVGQPGFVGPGTGEFRPPILSQSQSCRIAYTAPVLPKVAVRATGSMAYFEPNGF
jgi:hypothetical protein